MILSLIIAVLVIAAAIMQASQGFFSALIMAVLSICCAGAAFGAYEWVSVNLLAAYWKPDYAHAIALAVTFGVPLLVLRIAMDKLIRRTCLLPAAIDRAGGGVCGFVTGMVMVGVMACAIQMLPFDGPILGYARFERALRDAGVTQPPDLRASERNLWLSPDRFAAGAASVLSAGVFSGSRSFFHDHPDFVQEIGWGNAARAELSRLAPPQSIAVVDTQPIETVYRLIPGEERDNKPDQYEPLQPVGGVSLRMLRVELKNKARDARKSHAFTLRQFRLVGQEEPDGPFVQHFPIATQQADSTQNVNRHVRFKRNGSQDWPIVDEPLAPRDDNDNQVELVFELPPRFVPGFLEYKRSARAPVSFAAAAAAPSQTRRPSSRTAAPAAAPAADPSGAEPSAPPGGRRPRRDRPDDAAQPSPTPPERRGGRIRGATTLADRSFFGEQMPMELRAYRGVRGDTDIRRGTLNSGHIIAEPDGQAEGADPAITKFAVPSDKRLLHLNVGKLRARSALGRAIAQAVAVAQNYVVEDANGRQYQFVGKYAVASDRGKDVLEIQYYPDAAGSIGGVGQFDRIRENELKPDEPLVLLFLVDPGATIVAFTTGGDATRRDDLRGENLVAPQ